MSMTRRGFLRDSSVVVAGMPLLFGAAGALGEVPASERVRVGLIGCGGMGRGDLATFFMNPETECPVICDVDDAMLEGTVKLVEERRGRAPETVKDFRRVIEREDVDVLLVATPDHWHALPTIYGCQAGKDVYVEKPLAPTIQEGRAMVRAMQRHNRVVQMGTQWRSGKQFKDAVEIIQSGHLGKIRVVRAWAYLDWLNDIGNPEDCDPPEGVDYDMWLGPTPKRPFNPNRFHFNFRWFWDYAGGLMTDWGVHLLNVCLWAMGPETPRRVSSSGGMHALRDNRETPDTQITVYDFPDYSLIYEHSVGIRHGPNGKEHGMSFTGSEGTLTIDDSGWWVEPEPSRKSIEAYRAEASSDPRPAHVRNFLDCVKTREQPVEHLELGHFVSTVAHLGNLAFRTASEIHWDAETETAKDNPAANALVRANYRAPWVLPYAEG